MKKRINMVAGLQTSPNVITAPPGSFKVLDNCVCRVAGLIESRRGQQLLPYGLNVGTPAGHVVDAHAIGVWRCDETHAGDQLVDVSGNGNTLTSQAANNTPAVGRVGGARAYPFDGVNNASFLGNTTLGEAVRQRMLSDWTYERWVYNPTSSWSAAVHALFSLDVTAHVPTVLLQMNGATRKIQYVYETGAVDSFNVQTVTSTGVVPLDTWFHLAVEKSGSTVNFYLNGVNIGTVTGIATPNGGPVNPNIRDGTSAAGSTFFLGIGDDWRLSDIARGPTAILDSYNRGVGSVGSMAADALSAYAGVVVGHAGSRVFWDTGTSFANFTGTYAAPAPSELRMRFERNARRLYFTTDTGIKRLESLSSQPVSAGVAVPQLNSNTLRVVSDALGFLAQDTAVAYRSTLAHRDANRLELESAPGSRVVVRSLPNLAADTGAVVAAAGVVTVTFDAVHTLKPGDVIDLASTLTGFPFPYTLTVATVPSSFSVTAADGTTATSASSSQWDTGGAQNIHRRRVDVRIFLPAEAVVKDVLRLWRTDSIAGAANDPGDEMFLCNEHSLSSTDIANGYYDISDSCPDAMLGDSAYFSPSQETAAMTNDRPPLARDLAGFDSCLWFANVIQRQEVGFSVLATGGSVGVAVGDTLTIAMGGKSITLTASITANVGNRDGHYLVYLSGDVTGDDSKTAQSLISAINAHASNDFVDAFYLDPTSANPNPGSVLLRERGVGGGSTIDVSVSAHGLAFVPQLPVTGVGALSSLSSTYPHRIYKSKTELPDAVPILRGYEVVGDADEAILRIVECAGLLWVFKERSVWTVSPVGDGSYTVENFSPDLRLVGNDTPAVMGRSILFLSNLGPVQVSGSGVTPLGLPIDYDITNLFGYDATNFPMLPTLRRYAFGVAYASDKMWILALPTNPSDTFANALYIWNASTAVWTKWPIARSCGVVEPVTDLLWFGPGDSTVATLYKERKQFRREDKKDESITVNITTVTTNADGTVTFSFTGPTYPAVGGLLEQAGIYSPNKKKGVVSAVDMGSGTFTIYATPLLAGDAWANGTATVCAPIVVDIQWLEEHCDNPGMLKELVGANLHLQEGAFYRADFSLATELASSTPLKDSIAGPDGYNVTTYTGGGGVHDDYSPPTMEQRVAGYYAFRFQVSEAECYLKLAGLTLDFGLSTERTGRR